MKGQILHKFHDCFIQFIDELLEQFPQELSLHIARGLIKDECTSELLMRKYIEFVLPQKHLVDIKSDSFFTDDNIGFSQLADKRVLTLKNLWLSEKLDADDRKTIWRWFEVFNTLAERYKKL